MAVSYCCFHGPRFLAHSRRRISHSPPFPRTASNSPAAGIVHKATFTGNTILGGKWLELAEQDIQPATGYLAKYLIGYDSQQKLLVEFDANNFGAAIYTSEDGWQNRVLTMTSSISQDRKAPYAANRFQYSITAPDTFTVDWQISKTAELKWIEADHLACKRRGNNSEMRLVHPFRARLVLHSRIEIRAQFTALL